MQDKAICSTKSLQIPGQDHTYCLPAILGSQPSREMDTMITEMNHLRENAAETWENTNEPILGKHILVSDIL